MTNVLSMMLLLLLFLLCCSYNAGSILWLPTNEGITSQVVQIERLWGKAQAMNRSITIRNFECAHFSDVS